MPQEVREESLAAISESVGASALHSKRIVTLDELCGNL